MARAVGLGLAIASLCALAGIPSAASPSRRRAQDLARAYPQTIARVDAARVVMRNGRVFAVSDGVRGKSDERRLNAPDIDDMFVEPYIPGPPPRPPTGEPGRARYEPLFNAMYGDCDNGGVRLRRVAWMPGRHGGGVLFTTVNGADKALEAVVRDLERLPPSMTKYLVPAGGTYNCRKIQGTPRRSMHAYGAAIDISTRYSDYWMWKGEGSAWRNRIPMEVVEAFERHGFIWGGKWRHFDTMHFEYRPEMMPPPARS
jgi:hypothetical protein